MKIGINGALYGPIVDPGRSPGSFSTLKFNWYKMETLFKINHSWQVNWSCINEIEEITKGHIHDLSS